MLGSWATHFLHLSVSCALQELASAPGPTVDLIHLIYSISLTHDRSVRVVSATVFSGSDGLMWFCFICAGITSLMSFIMLILSGIVDDLQICIKVKGGHDALEIARKLPKDERSGFVTVKPWKDTQFAIRELGALINDIKLLGDAGIEKWKV